MALFKYFLFPYILIFIIPVAIADVILERAIFTSDRIVDRRSAYTFLQFRTDGYTYSSARVRYCDQQKTLVLGDECTAKSLTLIEVLQRIEMNRTVWFQVDYEACLKMDKEVADAIFFNAYKTSWMGWRVVQGPNSKNPTLKDPKCWKEGNRGTRNILMFDEHSHKGNSPVPGYTKTQLDEMYAANYLLKPSHMASDIHFLYSLKNYSIIPHESGRNMSNLAYILEGQPWPTYYQVPYV